MKRVTKTTTDSEGNLVEYSSEVEEATKTDLRLTCIIWLLIAQSLIGLLTIVHVTAHTRYFMEIRRNEILR